MDELENELTKYLEKHYIHEPEDVTIISVLVPWLRKKLEIARLQGAIFGMGEAMEHNETWRWKRLAEYNRELNKANE